MTLERVSQQAGALLECPIWDAERGRLLYLDYADPHIFSFDLSIRTLVKKRLSLHPPLGGLCKRSADGYLVIDGNAVHAMSPALEISNESWPAHNDFLTAPPNDVCVAPDGRLLVTTADRRETEPTGGLYTLGNGGDWCRFEGGLTVGNGPAIAPDGRTLYFVDSPKGVIYACRFNRDPFSIEHRRVFARVPESEGHPDGLAVDSEGCLWSARWGGGAIVRYSPIGKILEQVAVPARYVTSCAFGGDGLRTLFITTASPRVAGDSTRSDAGGHLFQMDVSVPGTTLPLAQL